MWEPLNLPFGKQIWRRVLAHETPAGAVFWYRSGGGFCMPAHTRLTLCGWGFGAASWLYAVDSLGLVPLTGMLRGSFTRLEMYRFPALTGRYPYGCRGGAKQGAHAPPQANKYRQANTGGRRSPAVEPNRPEQPRTASAAYENGN